MKFPTKIKYLVAALRQVKSSGIREAQVEEKSWMESKEKERELQKGRKLVYVPLLLFLAPKESRHFGKGRRRVLAEKI